MQMWCYIACRLFACHIRLPTRMLVTSCQNEFQFHTSTWQDNRPSVSPLTASATARGMRSRRAKNAPTRLPGHPSLLSLCSLPRLCSTLPAPLGTLENVTKISYWCLLFFCSVFIFYFSVFFFLSAFLMMLLKAIHKISHTATHTQWRGGWAEAEGPNKICVN